MELTDNDAVSLILLQSQLTTAVLQSTSITLSQMLALKRIRCIEYCKRTMFTETQMIIILSCLITVSLFDQSGKYSIFNSNHQCMGKETFLYGWVSEK